jgi:hypothetical protein
MEEQNEPCSHLKAITNVTIGSDGVCEECIKYNGVWVHLRTCQQCGITLCCDSSPGKHASQHHVATGHPVVASAEPEENWLWCYVNQQFARY